MMTPERFSQIKKSIETAKTNRDKAEGAKQKIEEQWKEEYNIDSLEDAENKIKELEEEIESDKKKLEKMYSQLEKITDWES
jgi:DNA repair exonuclease SbcCD ATPase subunit